MRIVLAPDSFKESMSAAAAAAAMARGVRAVVPDAECIEVPMADGGEGTTDALVATLGGQWRSVASQDALGRPIEARYGATVDGLAIIEVAAAVGIGLIDRADRYPMAATSLGERISPLRWLCVAGGFVGAILVEQGLPGSTQFGAAAFHRILQGAGGIGGVEHALGGLFRQPGHVVEAVARIGDVARRFFNQLVQTEAAQAVVQRARHVTDPAQDFFVSKPICSNIRRQFGDRLEHDQAFSIFSKILFSFSSSVAAVNGLTT